MSKAFVNQANVRPLNTRHHTQVCGPGLVKQKRAIHYDIHLESKLEKNMLERALGLYELVFKRDLQILLDGTPHAQGVRVLQDSR